MTSSLDDVKRRILTRVPLADLIGETVSLSLRSGNRTGCCPFHSEKTPSFYVYDDHYHCFGCKEHGDAISFVRKLQGLGFVESLRFLAEKYSIEAPELEQGQAELSRRKRAASLYELMLAAQEFFVQNLRSPDGAKAREYLESRGFTPASIEAVGFGLTPKEPFGLVRQLRSRGFREADMHECGLSTESTKDRRHFDFFKARLMLPIHDAQGRIIAFGGRTMDGHPAKYMNSRDTSLFDKGRTLYGFDKARKVMREKSRAIVVEGYMDTCMLWQHGFTESVACLGTAFTEHHMKLLKNATPTVVLLFDGDKAGRQATMDSVELALNVPELQIKAVRLPGGDDPDDFLKKHGAEALGALIEKAENLLDFAVRERIKETHELGVPELLTKELIPWVAKIPDQMHRAYLVSRLAYLTGMPMGQLGPEVDKTVRLLARPQRGMHIAGPGVAQHPGQRQERPDFHRNGAQTAPVTPLKPKAPPRPLDQVAFDLFGHVFFSRTGEIDQDVVRNFVTQDLELDVEYLQFIDEMFAVLQRNEVPANAEGEIWPSALAPEVAALKQRLHKSARAFDCPDRQGSIAKLIEHARKQKIKGTIGMLKTQLARLSAQRGQEVEVRRILQNIADLTKEMHASGAEK